MIDGGFINRSALSLEIRRVEGLENSHQETGFSLFVVAVDGNQKKQGTDQADQHILHGIVYAGRQNVLWVRPKDNADGVF